MGPVEREIRDRVLVLSDPKIKWVQRTPQLGELEACAVVGPHGASVSVDTTMFLSGFVQQYGTDDDGYALVSCASAFNDHLCSSREEVIAMLEEAADEAEAYGL